MVWLPSVALSPVVAPSGAIRLTPDPEGAELSARIIEAFEADLIEQAFFAAEEMGDARHIQEQRMRRIKRHERRVAVAPLGGAFEQLPIGGFVRRHHFELRQHRARIRERHAESLRRS